MNENKEEEATAHDLQMLILVYSIFLYSIFYILHSMSYIPSFSSIPPMKLGLTNKCIVFSSWA